MYDRLGQDSSKVGVWKCLACENINVTSNQTASLDSFESQNHFDVLNDTPSDNNIHSPNFTSTPKAKNEPQKTFKPKSKKNKIKRSVKVIVTNFRSIIDKKQEYENLLHSTKPDIIIGTESWLKPKHYDNEIFDPDMGYIPYRRDRIGQTGGGVFIAVRDTIIAQRVKEYETDCENIWVKIELAGQKPLIIGSYYKPHEHDEHSLQEFNRSLQMVTKSNPNIWVGGDFNLPKMDWDQQSPSSDCKYPTYYRKFIELVNDHSLQQMVNAPTTEKHVFDLFLTNNPTRVNRSNVIPGLSDHDIVQIDINVAPRNPELSLCTRKLNGNG
jgi:hypothetical protein